MSQYDDDDDFLTGDDADHLFHELSKSPEEQAEDLTEEQTTKAVNARAKLVMAQDNVRSASNGTSPFLDAIDIISEGLKSKLLQPAELQTLVDLLPPEILQVDAVDTDFDMMEELGLQRNLVNALRLQVMNPSGRGIRSGISVSEAKSVLDACRNFGEVIRKNMESVVNLRRIQALEAAIMEVTSGHGEDFKREFVAELEKQCKIYCRADK
ncbi:hypothetical protein vBVpaS1601_9 [Vibrio phage vB_VpaS_1601]|uniref:hypothetical protein n=1 Tax=Vibrio phage SHOU24 TaxID=1414739 RepID=UPI0003ED2598|nr:hypothetical protein SHOU24_77 [Vibrio phage SHOU24]AHI61274.1 hypothetical protein SHOU24_77 [Vibrio phage SHOU24]WHM52702.1 hypothetical protein vBVpaP1601_9 [Vibrio phage vB_VpaP_1601]